MGKPMPVGQALTLNDAQKAKPGTVVANSNGLVAQKHGPDKWFLAQDWESPVTDAEVVGDKFVAVTKWKTRH